MGGIRGEYARAWRAPPRDRPGSATVTPCAPGRYLHALTAFTFTPPLRAGLGRQETKLTIPPWVGSSLNDLCYSAQADAFFKAD